MIILLIFLTMYIWLPILIVQTTHIETTYSLNDIKTASLSLFSSFLGQGLIYSYLFWKGQISFNTHPFLSYPFC